MFLRGYQGAFCVLKTCCIVTKAVPYQGQYIFIYLFIYEQHYFMVFEAPVIHFSGFQQTKIKNILNSFYFLIRNLMKTKRPKRKLTQPRPVRSSPTASSCIFTNLRVFLNSKGRYPVAQFTLPPAVSLTSQLLEDGFRACC